MEEGKQTDIDTLIEQLEKLKEENRKLRLQKTVEYRQGLYRQKIITHDGKKRQKLTRLEKNKEKVTLCWIGMIEVYAYPFQSFRKIYMRLGKEVYGIDKWDVKKIFTCARRLTWYVEHAKDVVSGKIKSECEIAQEVIDAHNAGSKMLMDKMKRGETSDNVRKITSKKRR